MKLNIQYIIYFLGVVVLGLLYVPIKSALGSKWLFLFSVIAYLFSLRFIGAWVARKFETK